MYVIEISGLKKRFEKGGFCLDLPEMRVPEGYITGCASARAAGPRADRICGKHAGVSRPCHAGNPQADARAVLSKLGRGPLPEVL